MSFEDLEKYTINKMNKYKECRICGMDADCGYVNQEDGLCQACRGNEEYYEMERRKGGDDEI